MAPSCISEKGVSLSNYTKEVETEIRSYFEEPISVTIREFPSGVIMVDLLSGEHFGMIEGAFKWNEWGVSVYFE